MEVLFRAEPSGENTWKVLDADGRVVSVCGNVFDKLIAPSAFVAVDMLSTGRLKPDEPEPAGDKR